MPDILMSETRRSIIVITYSSEFLVELYECIVPRTASYSCWSVEFDRADVLLPATSINDATSLTTYTMHTHISETNIYI